MAREMRTREGLVIPPGATPQGDEAELRAELLEVRRVRWIDAPTEKAAIAQATEFLDTQDPRVPCLARSFDALDRGETDPDVSAWRLTYTEHRLYVFPVPAGS